MCSCVRACVRVFYVSSTAKMINEADDGTGKCVCLCRVNNFSVLSISYHLVLNQH